MNPIIRFTTLFGLLAVEPAVSLSSQQGSGLSHGLSLVLLIVSLVFVWRSFYGMRIEPTAATTETDVSVKEGACARRRSEAPPG